MMVGDIWIDLVICSLVTYGIADILAYEEGPFGLATTLRTFLYNRWHEITWVERGISCPKCWGFWVALPLAVYAGYVAHFDPFGYVLMWFAISGLNIFLHSLER